VIDLSKQLEGKQIEIGQLVENANKSKREAAEKVKLL
jgi:hypothetical protein